MGNLRSGGGQRSVESRNRAMIAIVEYKGGITSLGIPDCQRPEIPVGISCILGTAFARPPRRHRPLPLITNSRMTSLPRNRNSLGRTMRDLALLLVIDALG